MYTFRAAQRPSRLVSTNSCRLLMSATMSVCPPRNPFIAIPRPPVLQAICAPQPHHHIRASTITSCNVCPISCLAFTTPPLPPPPVTFSSLNFSSRSLPACLGLPVSASHHHSYNVPFSQFRQQNKLLSRLTRENSLTLGDK